MGCQASRWGLRSRRRSAPGLFAVSSNGYSITRLTGLYGVPDTITCVETSRFGSFLPDSAPLAAARHVRSASDTYANLCRCSENLHVPRARSAAKCPSFDVFADALLPQSKPAAPVAHECAPRQAAPWYRRPSRRGCRPCSSLNGPGRLVRARRDQRDQLAVMLDRIAEIGRLQAEIGERRARRGLIYARRAGCRRAVRTSGAQRIGLA